MAENKQPKGKVSQIFQQLLLESSLFPDIKQTIKSLVHLAEKHTFHAFIGNSEEYLHAYGLTYYQEEHFNYIHHMLHDRTTAFLDKIAESAVQVKSTIPPPPPPPPKIPSQIVQQVEQVLKNIDLPLSLFKRNDNYWSQDNPKTVQVKEYIKQLHDQDRKWKGELKKKRQEILNSKNQMYHKNEEETAKQELKMKEQDKIRKLKKIEYLKSQPDYRKKTIQQGLEFIKKQGRPLFKKMEQQFYNKVELPTLEQRKRKLSQVRELRKSVDLVQIQQHRQKFQKLKEEHQPVKILNEAVKVSFKGEFYRSLEKSSVRELSESSRVQSLHDKKKEYAQIVRQNFKPLVDDQKANEIAERIQQMHKRYSRAKNAFKYKPQGEQDEEEGEQQEQQEPEPQPEDQEEQEQEEQDEDSVPRPRDDQYVPSKDQRYKMGLKFLQQARKKRKKSQNKSQTIQSQDVKNRTFSVKQAIESQKAGPQHQTIASASNQSNRKIRYRNYLHQMSKTNKTIDFIDTSQIKSEFTEDMKLKNNGKQEQIENKLKIIAQKAKFEQQLLKVKKMKKQDALVRKHQLDKAILDTIKARLALMKS